MWPPNSHRGNPAATAGRRVLTLGPAGPLYVNTCVSAQRPLRAALPKCCRRNLLAFQPRTRCAGVLSAARLKPAVWGVSRAALGAASGIGAMLRFPGVGASRTLPGGRFSTRCTGHPVSAVFACHSSLTRTVEEGRALCGYARSCYMACLLRFVTCDSAEKLVLKCITCCLR